MKTIRLALAVLLALAFGASATAADSWVVSDRQAVRPGEVVRLALVTSRGSFPGGEQATDPALVASWFVQRPRQRDEIRSFAIDGDELAATHRFDRPGLHAIGVALHPRFVDRELDEFRAYLEEERAAEALIALETIRTGRELTANLAKTFVRVGEPHRGNSYRKPVGHPLEIIPLSDPCGWSSGDVVEVQVRLDGRPARGARVSSGHESGSGSGYRESVTTDALGRAKLRLDAGGHWYIRTHFIRAIDERERTAKGADWESSVASMTFRVAGPDQKPPRSDLSLVLRPLRATIDADACRWFVATITNNGHDTVTLVRPGDASMSGWRTPIVGWSVLPAAADEVHPEKLPLRQGGRCGLVNPLLASDVVSLARGETMHLGEWTGHPRFPGPGLYRVVYYYVNDPGHPWSGTPMGKHDDAAMQAVKTSMPCELVSNEIVVRVK